MTYDRDVVYTAEQQEAFSQEVNKRLRTLGWNRIQAAEAAGVQVEKVSALARTAPPGMAYGTFLKVMLALDIDLYEVCELLGLTDEVKRLAQEDPAHHPNARKYLGGKRGSDPMTALVSALPEEKREGARRMIDAILRNA